MRIADGVLWNASVRPDKPAICMDGRTVTYGELQSRMMRIILAFYQKGYCPKTRIALILENQLEYVELFLGLAHAGMVVSPINPRLSDEEKEAILFELNPAVVICEQENMIYVYPFGFATDKVLLADWISNQSEHHQSNDYNFNLSDDDIFYLGFSSGTTGRPKGILRTHRSWTDSFFAMSIEFKFSETAYLLVPGPLCYSASLIACLHILFVGGTVELHQRFDAARVLHRLMQEEINTVFMVPAMYREIIVQTANLAFHAIERTIQFVTAGDKMNEETKQLWLSIFPNGQLYEYYGTSEVGFVSVLKPEDQLTKPESVGKPFFSTAVKCVDDEIWVKSTMGFAGYDGWHKALEAKIRRENAWLVTSDYGYFDNDGYLYVSGRMGDKMVCGGINIYPMEIQSILEHYPDIAEAYVFAVPDERLSEKPVAVIVWKPGVVESVVSEDFERFLKQKCSGYKRPRFWWSRTKLPRNASGKVLKAVLIDEYNSRINHELQYVRGGG